MEDQHRHARAAMSPGPLRLDRDRSLLLVIDVQERLVPHVHQHASLVARVGALVSAARRLGIPAVATEHCAAQLGPTIPSLRSRFDAGAICAKTHFGATGHAEFTALLRGHDRPQVVVAGMEAHVCVLQTVLGLVDEGCDVLVVGDAVGSRAPRLADRQFALERMARAGCTIAGTETALFEWARAGDDPSFRDILALVRALPS